MKHEVMRMENITYNHKGMNILNNFFINLFHGELLGIIIHNSVEKSHLIDLLCGNLELKRGRTYFENISIDYVHYKHISKKRIFLIQSKPKLIDNMTVADNIFIIRNMSWRYIFEKPKFSLKAQSFLKKLGIAIDPKRTVNTLSAFEKVALEITKSYALNANIIILENLSSYLADSELSKLVAVINDLKKEGMSFLMFDSFVDVLKKFSDRICVIKNGLNVWTLKKDQINENIINAFFFNPQKLISENFHEKNAIAMKFVNISTENLAPLSFEIRSGQIMSLFDKDGSCIDEIISILNGNNTSYTGNIFIGDKLLKNKKKGEYVKTGLAIITENPVKSMLLENISAVENLFFATIGKLNKFWVTSKYYTNCKQNYGSVFTDVDLDKCTDTLSIYDQQKLVYLKWHLYNPYVVVCIRPFSSADTELRKVTSEMMELLLKKGIAILVLGSNYSEVDSIDTKIIIRSKKNP